jgi:hypothetical protein
MLMPALQLAYRKLCVVQYAFKMRFDFDSTLSAAENIEKFYKHMESIDAELAAQRGEASIELGHVLHCGDSC